MRTGPSRAAVALFAGLATLSCASAGNDAEAADADAKADVSPDYSTDVDGAGETADVANETCVEGESCAFATCHKGKRSCDAGACLDDGLLPTGTACGVFASSSVCNAAGECVPCMKGDPCVPLDAPCMNGVLDCSAGKATCAPTTPMSKNTACGENRICDTAGKCVGSVVTAGLTCPSVVKTCNELCASKGFASAVACNGYWWFQCGGPLDCPGGFKGEGISCPDFCIGKDCVAYPFCGGSYKIESRGGDGTTSFHADEFGIPCAGYNPGWTVRLRCQY